MQGWRIGHEDPRWDGCGHLPFAYKILFLSSPVGFKGKLSLLDLFVFFPGGLSKWKPWFSEAGPGKIDALEP